MKPDLTPARERFCHEVAKHGNLSAAYRIAFPSSKKWQEQSVCVKASRLMASAKVGLRVAELRKATERHLARNRQDWLEEVARLAWDRKSRDQLSALVQYGKAQGYYEPEKVAVAMAGVISHEVHISIQDRLERVLEAGEKQGVIRLIKQKGE